MSARQPKAESGADPLSVLQSTEDLALSEGNGFCVATPENPLHRNISVSIRASLNQLCLQKSKATWAPSSEALHASFQQRKFTSLNGDTDCQGDLKSVVLHDLSVEHSVSTFPMPVGAKITGVDDRTYASTGEPYSLILLPNSNSSNVRSLQADDVSLAYDFAKKFPGYTSDNLSEKGIHEVSQRRFCLVASDHPIVSAISENAERLQMGEITMMPEGLVKISSGLYESILPIVKSQVESQIKVRDFSRASVAIQPAEHSSWNAARAELLSERKRPLLARKEAAIAAAGNEAEAKSISAAFQTEEAELENSLDHEPMDFHLQLGVKYNFLSK